MKIKKFKYLNSWFIMSSRRLINNVNKVLVHKFSLKHVQFQLKIWLAFKSKKTGFNWLIFLLKTVASYLNNNDNIIYLLIINIMLIISGFRCKRWS